MDVDDMDFPLPESPAQPQGGIRIGQSLGSDMQVVSDATRFKRWVCLYPLYFDSALSVESGRKVPRSLSIDSPHVRQISMAVKRIGLSVCLEPNKTHPRDFFRPGRVRVQLFDADGRCMHGEVRTRRQLLRRVAEELPRCDAPRDKEPSLEDLIAQGALPSLPGMQDGGLDMHEDSTAAAEPNSAAASTSKPKVSKKAAKSNKKKGKAKTIV
ncbi:signal recognition particle subunit [Coemansia erecta]|nr:signal recognition particle subunit [Coemansia erecta]